MSALTSEKDALDAWLASPAAYAEAAREELKAKVARQGELTWQLARLETAVARGCRSAGAHRRST